MLAVNAVPPQKAAVFKLPSEVAEIVVVLLAEYPVAIAAVAQTCRYYRSLIYDTPDDHLWRNVFVTLFDDWNSSNYSTKHLKKLEWGDEYRRRVWSYRYLRKAQRPHRGSSSDPTDSVSMRKALITVLEMLETAAPHRLTDVDKELSSLTTNDSKDESLVQAHFRAPNFPSLPHNVEEPTTTMLMYVNAVCLGLPIALVRRLFSYDGNAAEALLNAELHRFVAFNGLRISPPHATTFESDDAQAVTVKVEHDSAPPDAVFVELEQATIFSARKKVYDMSYPQRRRMFGPFVASQLRATKPSQYSPDWEQLAAVRLVVEAAVRAEYDGEDDELSILNLMALRAGRWTSVPSTIENGAFVQRDWAGVSGLWRRFVIWYGYPTLLDLNDTDFDEQVMKSAWEVRACVPVRLRIVSYTHDDGSPEAFPTINVEGEMGGEGWRDRDEDDPDDDGDQRYVDGKVTMLSDGSIRWSMWTYLDSSKSERQWASEGVQLGWMGSGTGAIGTWTGANHEEGDPVGAWWQWRVE